MILYAVLILATGAERIAEMIISKRNAAWSFARGGVESNRRQMPWMVTSRYPIASSRPSSSARASSRA